MTRSKSKVRTQKLKVKRKSAIAEEARIAVAPPINSSSESSQPQRKFSRMFFIVVVLVLIGAALYFAARKWGNMLVVATVNGRPVTRFELWSRLEKKAGQQTLDEVANEILIEQEASKKNLTVAQKDLDAKIKDLEKRFQGKDGLNKMLTLQGMNRDELIRQLKFQILVEKMIPPVKVSNQEITNYYESNQEQFGEELTDLIKSQIKDTLFSQKTSESFSSWFEKLKKTAKINKYL